MDSHKLNKTSGFYYFGDFKIDLEDRQLWCGKEIVPLTPKEFEVLLCLVERRGKIAEKNDLLDAIWGETFVEEATLARNISWLRKKLARFSVDENFIETVPKRGYRFAADVIESSDDENLIIIEEESIQHFEIKETFDIPNDYLKNSLPSADQPTTLSNPKPKREKLKLIWFAIGLLIFAGIGFAGNQIYFHLSKAAVIEGGKRFKLMLKIRQDERLYLSGGRSDRRGDPASPSTSVITKRQLIPYEKLNSFKSYHWLVDASGPVKYGEKYLIRIEEENLFLSGGRTELDIFDDEVVAKEDLAGRKERLDARKIIVRNNRTEPEKGMTWVYTNPMNTVYENSQIRNKYYWQICRTIKDCGTGEVRFGDKAFLRMTDLSGDFFYLVGGKGHDEAAVFTNLITDNFDSENQSKYYLWKFVETE